MKSLKLLIFFWLIPYLLNASPPDEVRKQYSNDIHTAFQLQAMGKTELANVVFREAKKYAIKNGESQEKIYALQDLFTWYQKYGYSCGLLETPSGVLDEYRTRQSQYYNLDPTQKKLMKDFLFGVGQIISGIFCVSVSRTPNVVKCGFSLITSGITTLFKSITSMQKNDQEKKSRLEELKKIEERIETAAQ